MQTSRYLFISVLLIIGQALALSAQTPLQPILGNRVVSLLRIDGLLFKDLNKNGRLDKYEDWRLPVEVRVDDLVSQMTIEEKAGLMVGPSLTVGPNNGVSQQPTFMVNPFNPGPPAMVSPATLEGLYKRHIRQFINRDNLAPQSMVNWLNAVQQMAEGSRLGIPVLFVTNPRNTFGAAAVFGITEAGSSFSQWPGTLGLAAMRDTALVEDFARIAAQEYVSVGLRGAYHPTADLGTEPRWGRFKETFGEDAALTTELITAYIRGFQGRTLGPQSVALVAKHFPGAGPALGGQDAHFAFGKNQVYPGQNLEYHLQPWRAAIREGTAMIMPYYAVPKGMTTEEVGMSYNREIVTDLLRD
ncbi:MAG: glycoside hydrolase family 3 N-terminal domain-containing protein, partial [Acidobacteriota bacterium]